MICAVYDLLDCSTPDIPAERLLTAMYAAADRLGATVLDALAVPFQPHGLTCVLVLAESHLVVSTWPEHRLAHVDLFTCRADAPANEALHPIIEILGSRATHKQDIRRHTPSPLGRPASRHNAAGSPQP
ncbi:S-adenosylmethionine decarboxylase family protein [Streptomyces sp. NBRC 109706]|uniref:S-adenosylmethionine decarboxylase family protein n=1 Tax=Streptomyces sp. NBRC 109706 TaxID=1550035 RepID=UPI00082E7496|nr:S-adenosylmethionine decarboxylase [Streptomyces sp. NBRC 109706]